MTDGDMFAALHGLRHALDEIAPEMDGATLEIGVPPATFDRLRMAMKARGVYLPEAGVTTFIVVAAGGYVRINRMAVEKLEGGTPAVAARWRPTP